MIELLLAFSLFGLVSAAAFGALIAAGRAWRGIEAGANGLFEMQSFLGAIGSDLSNAYLGRCDERIQFKGTADTLSFVRQSGSSGFQQVGYETVESGDGSSVRRWTRRGVVGEAGPDGSGTLSHDFRNVARAGFKYYDQSKQYWTDTWNSGQSGSMPALVEVTVSPSRSAAFHGGRRLSYVISIEAGRIFEGGGAP